MRVVWMSVKADGQIGLPHVLQIRYALGAKVPSLTYGLV